MDAFYTKLPHRGLIHIEGTDRHEFLQGLITNDINLLNPGTALYACLLSPQGKFLHDFFITEGDGFLLMDCEGGERAQDLFKRLNMYKLRKDVQISVEDIVPVYAVFGGNAISDPRHPEMGGRVFEKPQMEERPFEEWDKRRIQFCIPDGSRDFVIGQSTLDEGRIDVLHGLSYDKGCYVGQELTARMHYRGLGKKHLYAVEGNNPPKPFTEIRAGEKLIGEMRSSCGDTAIALLKDDSLGLLETAGLKQLNAL